MTVRRSSMIVRCGLLLLFLVVLVGSRSCRLADKPLHHDESLFGYYSYFFSEYGEYIYDPILHGPLLIELVAGGFRLFGDNDFTLRLVPLLCGLALFPLLLALRPWFGRWGTPAALLLLLVSPNLCYYSRFLRNDMLFVMLTVVNLVAIAHALGGRSAWPIVLWPASLALLISNKENVVFLMASQVGFAFLWVALDDRRIAARDTAGRFALSGSEIVLSLLRRLNLSLLIWCPLAWIYWWKILPHVPLGLWVFPIWFIGVAVTAAWFDAALRAPWRDRERTGLVFRLYRSIFTERNWWIVGCASFVAIIYFCFSIALTQPRSLFGSSGLIAQTIGYWWGEHASERLGGAFHVYAPQILVYEIPACAMVLAALLRDWVRNLRLRWAEVAIWAGVAAVVWGSSLWEIGPEPSGPVRGIDGIAPRTAYDELSGRLASSWDYLHIRTTGALFWAASVAYWGMIWTVRSIRAGRIVRGWFVFWLFTSYLFYGYAGEKVPWLALHIVLPLLLLAAMLWGEWAGACTDRRRRGFVAALMAALLTWNGWQMGVLCFANPTNPAEIMVYNHTHYEGKTMAKRIARWIDDGQVSDASRVLVQGEASWPWTWYLRRYETVRFVPDDFVLAPTDEVVVADPGEESTRPMLTMDFEDGYFALRYAWIPPSISFNEILCLRRLVDEPRGFGARLRYRAEHSGKILRDLGEYLLFRRPVPARPPAPGEEPYLFVHSAVWVRVRATPEPLMPPSPEGLLPPDFDRGGRRPVLIDEGMFFEDVPATGSDTVQPPHSRRPSTSTAVTRPPD